MSDPGTSSLPRPVGHSGHNGQQIENENENNNGGVLLPWDEFFVSDMLFGHGQLPTSLDPSSSRVLTVEGSAGAPLLENTPFASNNVDDGAPLLGQANASMQATFTPPIWTPAFASHANLSPPVWECPVAQSQDGFPPYVDMYSAEPNPESFGIMEPHSLAVVDYLPPQPTAQQSYPQIPPSIDAPMVGGMHDFLEAGGPSQLSNNLNSFDDEWAYLCYNNEGWLTNEIRAPLTLGFKPTEIQQATVSAVSPQPVNMNSSSGLPGTKKRKRFDNEGREKVKRVRKLGACFRCRIYKLPCNEELPCTNCLKVKDSKKVYRGPCIRPNIDEAHTFRAGDGDNGFVRAILPKYQWPSGGKTKSIKLQWPFRVNTTNTPILIIGCQEFRPKNENLAEEYVANGVVRHVKLPPWACRNTTVASKNIKRFMTACQSLLEDEIRETLDDPIMILTWNEIERYRATYGSPLITRALQIYAGAMMNSKYPTSIEANVFGVKDETHTPYFFEKLPLPAQLTYQIQTMIAQAMLEVQTQLLKDLRARIFSKQRHDYWYEVFLTTFILLASIEWVYQIQIRFIKAKQGVSTRNFTNISYVTQYMFDEWEASAFNMINHFRYIMNGHVPFSQCWDDNAENPRRTGLDSDSLTFIRNIKRETEERREELQALRKEQGKLRFEKPLAAICELFLPPEEKEQ